jgi:glycosyltransferase involved in cell wall biosynthesis
VFVVRNGPDTAVFKPSDPNPDLKYGRRFLVGYVGTMAEQEGLDILIRAAALIKELGRDDVHFTCVGGGPALPQLKKMVADMGIPDRMNFTGRVPERQLLDILSTADVCVNPDRPCEMNNISTMIKIMEYMALGKPIVQFDLREARISADEASLYAESGRLEEDFARKIVWLLDHPFERARMGEYGIRRVEEKLAWRHSVPHLLNAYNRVLGRCQLTSESDVAPRERRA